VEKIDERSRWTSEVAVSMSPRKACRMQQHATSTLA
jgi:hypothetical protein